MKLPRRHFLHLAAGTDFSGRRGLMSATGGYWPPFKSLVRLNHALPRFQLAKKSRL
jgi:hypothetical protein